MKSILIIIFLFIFFSCDLVFIPDTSGINTSPSNRNQIITPADRISISFNFDVSRLTVENIFQIKSIGSSVNGIKEWDNNTMYFTPRPELSYGQRYVLSCSGKIKDTEDHKYELNIEVPFYYSTSQTGLPIVLSITPSAGAQVNVTEQIVITFSNPIEPWSFKEGFSLTPNTDYNISWNAEATTVTITPDDEWTNLAVYTVKLTDSIKDINGLPLASNSETSFVASSDTVNPSVISVLPAITDWTGEPPFCRLEVLLNNIAYDNSIRIDFSEEMDPDTAKSALSITPNLNGTKVFIDGSLDPAVEYSYLVFIPSSGIEMNTAYTITIKNTAEDIYGNTLLDDYIVRFTSSTSIPRLHLYSINVDEDNSDTDFPINESEYSTNNEANITVSEVDNEYTFTFEFSESFSTNSERISVQENIDITCIFPVGGISPSKKTYSWPDGGTTIVITFTNFQPAHQPNIENEYYYMLELKGGTNGIRNNTGSYLEEDILQLLKTN